MPNLIFKVGNYNNKDAIERLVNYIMSSAYIERYDSRGCFLIPQWGIIECVRNSFHAVKNVHYKTDGQLVQHIIVGLGDMDISEEGTCMIASVISGYYFMNGYQSFWGSHWGSENCDSYRHIHVALNTINAMTGERFFPKYDNMNDLKLFLSHAFPGVPWTYITDGSFYHEA